MGAILAYVLSGARSITGALGGMIWKPALNERPLTPVLATARSARLAVASGGISDQSEPGLKIQAR